MKFGVLALQGAFAAHCSTLRELGVSATLVRTPAELAGVDAIVLPGGESTTMTKLLTSSGLFDPLAAAVDDGLPVFGTCAGLILLSSAIEPEGADVRCLGAIDVTAVRNAYGRQIDSFEQSITLCDDDDTFDAVFIRAPAIARVGPSVEVLATLDGRPVLVRRGPVMAATFHPELTADPRIHERFVRLATSTAPASRS